MKIGIDCSLVLSQMAGIGQYTFNLVKNLIKLDQENNYLLYPVFEYNRDYSFYVKNLQELKHQNVKIAYQNLPKKIVKGLWNKKLSNFNSNLIDLENYLKFGNIDLLHSTTFYLPKFKKKCTKVVTIYDVSFMTHPEHHTAETIENCTKGTKEAVNIADIILVISEHTKKDLIEYFKVSADKIIVTYLGKDESFRKVNDSIFINNFLAKHNLPKDYILFVGSLEPRKNVKGLIKAYAQLSEQLKQNYPLVITGAKGWLNSDIYPLVQDLKLEKYLHFTGYITQEEMPLLYSQSSLFVYPSLYEGFGLPVLEAMACEVPVITSNISSIPEITGENGAILINPNNDEELSNKIKEVLESSILAENLAKNGKLQSEKFSWENCAKETLKIYQSLICD